MPRQRFSWMVAVVSLASSLSQAGTFQVDTTVDEVDALPGDGACATSIGTCTLRAAIQEANALPGEDVIEVPPGDYALTIPGSGEDAASTGDLDISDDLVLTGAGLEETLIDGAGLDRVFDIPWLFDPDAFPIVELAGVTVLGGAAEPGGGIRAEFAQLRVLDSAVEGNLGGGIDLSYGALQVSQSSVEGNSSDDSGGGIYAYWSDVTIEGSAILGNDSAAGGGGLAAGDSEVTIRDSLVSENSAAYTGGLSLGDSSLLAERTTVSNNSAAEGAGGIGQGQYTAGLVSSSTIAGNRSDSGAGGIRVGSTSVVTIENSTISGNAGFEAGGIGLESGAAQISSSTIVDNESAQGGGGIGAYWGSPIGIKSSILAENRASLAEPDCFVEGDDYFYSDGHNILGDATGCDFGAVPSDQVGVAPTPIDPRLGPLAENGGPTLTHALLPGSPAVDVVPPDSCLPLTADQRAVDRPQGVACDAGAFELEQPIPPPPGGTFPLCKIGNGGKERTKLVAPNKLGKQLANGLLFGECATPSNGRVMCRTKSGGRMSNVLIAEGRVQRALDKGGFTLGACSTLP